MMKKQKVDAQNLITKIIFKDKNFKFLKALKIATKETEKKLKFPFELFTMQKDGETRRWHLTQLCAL